MRTNKLTDMFNSIINTYALREIHLSGGQYTWTNNQIDPTLEKLDRFLMSSDWVELFPLATVHKLSRDVSDHNHLILDTMENKPKNKYPFRFEKNWIKEEDFLARVGRIWQQNIRARNSLDRVQKKLKAVKNSLKVWGHNLRGRDKKRKSDISLLLAELEMKEEFSKLSASDIQQKAALQQEMLDILDKEECFWRQRARDNWLLKGDSNTTFFHRMANGCKRKSKIFSLKNGDSVIQGDDDLLNHATQLYKNLFGPAEDRGVRLNVDIWNNAEKLDDTDSETLSRRFTEKEVKDVVDQMEKNKAAGPD
jgi:hypothetical protein